MIYNIVNKFLHLFTEIYCSALESNSLSICGLDFYIGRSSYSALPHSSSAAPSGSVIIIIISRFYCAYYIKNAGGLQLSVSKKTVKTKKNKQNKKMVDVFVVPLPVSLPISVVQLSTKLPLFWQQPSLLFRV